MLLWHRHSNSKVPPIRAQYFEPMRHKSAPLWSPCNLEQPGVGVAGVSPGEKFIKVILAQDELDPLDVVRVLRPPGPDEIHLVIVQRLDGLQHFPGQNYKSGDVGGAGGGGGQT